MRDFQRSKFYAYEEAVLKECLPHNVGDWVTFDESESLIKRICASYNVKPPQIKKGRVHAFYRSIAHEIHLPEWALRDNVVIHEVAHAISYRKMVGDSHGPNFVRIWMELFSRMYDVPMDRLERMARERGVKFTPSKILA